MKKIIEILMFMIISLSACQKDNDLTPVVSTPASSQPTTERTTPQTGWATTTGYLNDLTTTQTTILGLIAGYNGQSSGQSASYSGAVFLTDCANGDGTRIRNAIQDYHNWFVSPPAKNACTNPTPPASVISNMKSKLQATYNTTDRSNLVNWIIAKYNAQRCSNPYSFTVPTTDNATLAFLGIRKQCLEWACTLAGNSIGYSGPFVANQTSFRRGMGLYEYNSNGTGKHAMVITDIYWTVSNGVTTATKFKVAESNYASGWSNPLGAIPWQRTIAVGRVVNYNGSPLMKVVKYGDGFILPN